MIYEPYGKGDCNWCGQPATEEHHLFKRSIEPKNIDNPENKIPLCGKCHRETENNEHFMQLLQLYFYRKPRKKPTIEYISFVLENNEIISPRDLSIFHRYLAAIYSNKRIRKGILEVREVDYFNAIRGECSSDKQAKSRFDSEAEGKEMIMLNQEIKAIERLLSSLKSSIESARTELNNYI